MATFLDDLGHPVQLAAPARRIVSLVPSLSEAVAVTVPERLVGATDWCTHPAGLDVPRVRGTKNPDRAAIAALRPDLVIANQEENRQLDVERLRAGGIAVWVTVIESVPQSLASMQRLFVEALDIGLPGWLTDAERLWMQPPPSRRYRVVVPIWRDPWMVVGSRTFTGDLLERLGLDNAFGDNAFGASADRYPHVSVAAIGDCAPDVVLLPDEPYVFTAADGPEAFPDRRVVLVSGRWLTWYGPSLLEARAGLLDSIG
jgi:ABC-type Fe3+-hydroxamate transport system substrate-binding protein